MTKYTIHNIPGVSARVGDKEEVGTASDFTGVTVDIVATLLGASSVVVLRFTSPAHIHISYQIQLHVRIINVATTLIINIRHKILMQRTLLDLKNRTITD